METLYSLLNNNNFEKYLDIKFHESPFSGSGVLCGLTDGHDEAVSRFIQFCERA